MRKEDFTDDDAENLVKEVQHHLAKLPAVRGLLPKSDDDKVTQLHIRIGEKLVNQAKRWASKDPRFDGDLSAYVRDAIADRIDKSMEQGKAEEIDRLWKVYEATGDFKSKVSYVDSLRSFLTTARSTVYDVRRVNDQHHLGALLQSARLMYELTESEEVRVELKAIFPELD